MITVLLLRMPPLPSNPNTQNTQWGGTALYVAARCKHEDVIELLLEAKANPDQQIEVLPEVLVPEYLL